MTYLFNDPSDFAKELTEGIVAANSEKLRQVSGGVVRNTKTADGTVVVIIGGGSGHYPAFAGLVGQGMAHGAAMGNLFASPSAQQIYNVSKAANKGGGVVLAFGNYAGDVLHFGQAREKLRAEGIPCEIVLVTDDISSASVDEIEKRRGVAGDLTVFKVACAAADAGYSLDEVVAFAKKANSCTRTLGVAFAGCTLPGATEPLFSVPENRMAIGLGIHGEPGISESDIPLADDLAELFIDRLMSEIPVGVSVNQGAKATVILNGLGSVKYEELFVVYRKVAKLLTERGVTVIEPEVGEFVTSFNMAGASLTIMWLDDDLEKFWKQPANAPAFRKGSVEPAPVLSPDEVQIEPQEIIPDASPASRKSAACIFNILEAIHSTIKTNCEYLGHIDAVAGDGDHGIGMERGSRAAVEKAREMLDKGAGAGTLLGRAADEWADKAGGTSGAIWGVALNSIASTIGDSLVPDAHRVAEGIKKAKEGIMHFGKAKVGDKTLVDVLVPFSEALCEQVQQQKPLNDAWRISSIVASDAAGATANLLPKMGRARPLAEKSLGTPDAGAVSLSLIVNRIGQMIESQAPQVQEA
ncbi:MULTISPECIES: dihydroxyacetone kinase family protein [unclassified Pantoea]|uniref:dihydroxyacetone kinase family protein n=1 Tax=unclassified Pantoea TaxID=2630326 RepID=UPI001CD6D4E7|nr:MULTISPECIES: dihydroxyacetone kinase family protein [unclassified Pantoea]MCA1179487.1 dihydroxyacetone kinase family protein [Pantoea sp. alder69]MCA1251740.1 dihydroxyacetone kinase family protein [Pantoea sp. alder70]MCA1267923.1 dihydroxyacetone kinase family protein [Pantoea sp. alder81]